jgi:hypothetical protein
MTRTTSERIVILGAEYRGGDHAGFTHRDDALFVRPRGTPMNLVATGWAPTSVLVGLSVICCVLSFIWPTSGLAHGWVDEDWSDPGPLRTTALDLAQRLIVQSKWQRRSPPPPAISTIPLGNAT